MPPGNEVGRVPIDLEGGTGPVGTPGEVAEELKAPPTTVVIVASHPQESSCVALATPAGQYATLGWSVHASSPRQGVEGVEQALD